MIDMENCVRQMMIDQVADLDLSSNAATVALRAAANRRRGRRRLTLIAGSGAAFAVAGTGIAAGTGAVPWWSTEEQASSSPFVTSSDPASLVGSQVRLTEPGPEAATFEIVTNTVTVGSEQLDCTAVQVKDAQGRSQHLEGGCGRAGALVPRAAGVTWSAPSGSTFAIETGPAPTSDAATVVLQASGGTTIATGQVEGGYYLIFAPEGQLPSTGSLVFYDGTRHVVDEFTLDLAPLGQ